MNQPFGIQKLFIILAFIGMVGSVFLPFYASTSDGVFYSHFVVLGSYQKQEDYFSIYNGFNSLFALFNLCSSLIIILLTFILKTSIRTKAVILLSILICSLILITLGTVTSGLMLSPSDRLLPGFYIMVICEVIILVWLFNLASHQKESSKRGTDEILDNLS